MGYVCCSWGRKDAFPGAAGSTITESFVTVIPIYGATGNSLNEGSTGVKQVSILSPGVLNNNTSHIYAVKYPLAFIFSTNADLYDWYANSVLFQNNTMWNGNQIAKSSYDPCPQEWRVPQDGTWNDFSSSITLFYVQGIQNTAGSLYATNGIRYNNMTWYPAQGYRSYSTGTFGGVGYDSGAWSRTPKDTRAQYLYFSKVSVIGNGFHFRALCLPVRCVQE